MSTITTNDLCLQYGERVIADHLNLTFDKPEIVSIIGPNGAGKSTILKSLARLLVPTGGAVYLDGKDLQSMDMNTIARTVSVLPQSTNAPGDMTVRDLVTYGRLPYQGMFSKLKDEDTKAIDTALKATEMEELQHNRLSDLSGGERQRAWLSLAIAKEPQVLLLDEPTTYLDIRHQLALMELVVHLYKTRHIIVIMVMHDLNHAARYSHRLIAVKKGHIVADGPVDDVFCQDILEPLYGIKAIVTKVHEKGEDYLACFPYAAV
ncbi:ABC transporter ATP-binding protein [uncultured Megasphaera sp.]|uniref:ABC transporter ATP-binding protein n=1 Tax=uncultured Megasphaera sp. TaxID=165188 RepID=UPI00265AE092|nr:ABC transporter ATP-binding protein [uncultured Megasphaera sp.]